MVESKLHSVSPLDAMQSQSSGAVFSECRSNRYALWRIWDSSKPNVLFIGLNPSTANETENDPTIKSVIRIAKYNGFGGIYMCNCFTLISTDPQALYKFFNSAFYTLFHKNDNDSVLSIAAALSTTIVFAWGNFSIVKELGRDKELIEMFPMAKALHINKNGSPKHPLYCKSNSTLINFNNG